MDEWQDVKLLVLGMTYPSYSEKYTENVCTGAIRSDNGAMVRIHPVPLRYLNEGNRFKSFQWVNARVSRHSGDPRPESLRILAESVEPGDVLDDVHERRRLIEGSPHMCTSVEELHERWERNRTSLGIVRPKAITSVRLRRKTPKDRAEWIKHEKRALAQISLFDRAPKPLDFPEVKFEIGFACDDVRCTGHEMNILQWGLHELYRKLARDPKRDEKVIAEMKRRLDLDKKDVFFFLGNFRSTLFNFGLMDSFSAPKVVAPRQLALGLG
jgi:hypothetical protein